MQSEENISEPDRSRARMSERAYPAPYASTLYQANTLCPTNPS